MASTSTFNSAQLYLKTKCIGCRMQLGWFQMHPVELQPFLIQNIVGFTLSLVREESGCILSSRTYFKSLRFGKLFFKFYIFLS